MTYEYPALSVSDLHLTVNPNDEYRWGVFQQIKNTVIERNIKTIFILGDITDAKDFHSATLVNRLVAEIYELSQLAKVLILRGNHDYLKEGHSFFEFLKFFGVPFITKISAYVIGDDDILFVPHSKTFKEDIRHVGFSNYRMVFLHQTVDGAISENGTKMENDLTSDIFTSKGKCKFYSGDIHKPQTIGNVEYIGSPYPVKHGDNFVGGCVIFHQDGNTDYIDFVFPKRMSINVKGIDEFYEEAENLEAGDSVKVALSLLPYERADWFTHKNSIVSYCAENGIHLASLSLMSPDVKKVTVTNAKNILSQRTPGKIMTEFASIEGLGGELLDAGLDLIGE